MARLRYELLKPGPWVVGRNSDGSLRKHTFTPDYVKGVLSRTVAMQAAGIPIPVCWEHQDGQKPRQLSRDEWVSEKAKGTAGWAEKLYNQKSKSTGFVDVEVPDETDASKAKTLRFCSPEIANFTDGSGKEWGEVITHIALTPKPAQVGQEPVLQLSGESWQVSGPVMRLARDSEDGSDEYESDPPQKKKKKGPPKGDDSSDDDGDSDDMDGEGMGSGDIYRICEALRSTGMFIPDQVKDAAGLEIAILSNAGNPQQSDMGLEEISPAMSGAGGGATPMMMSDEATKRLSTLEARNTQLEAVVFNGKKADLTKRLSRLLKHGLCSRPEYDEYVKLVKEEPMRLSTTGTVERTVTEVWIQARETAPTGAGFSLKNGNARLSNAEQIDPDEGLLSGGTVTAEQRKAWRAEGHRHAEGNYRDEE